MVSAHTDRQSDTNSSSKDPPGIQLLRRVWRDRRIAISVAVVVPATVALLCALAMPRGPLTTTQALVTMIAGLLTGGSVALVLRSRWAMALASVVFVTMQQVKCGQGPALGHRWRRARPRRVHVTWPGVLFPGRDFRTLITIPAAPAL